MDSKIGQSQNLIEHCMKSEKFSMKDIMLYSPSMRIDLNTFYCNLVIVPATPGPLSPVRNGSYLDR